MSIPQEIQALNEGTLDDLFITSLLFEKPEDFCEGRQSINHPALIQCVQDHAGKILEDTTPQTQINRIHALVRRAFELQILLEYEGNSFRGLLDAMHSSTDNAIIGEAVQVKRIIDNAPEIKIS